MRSRRVERVHEPHSVENFHELNLVIIEIEEPVKTYLFVPVSSAL